MSQLGQSRRFEHAADMSAMAPIATPAGGRRNYLARLLLPT
jgi:hypothetical protein